MEDVIISVINRKLANGILHPSELRIEIYNILKNKFPLETLNLSMPHIWFIDVFTLSLTIHSLNIYWDIQLKPDNRIGTTIQEIRKL